MRLADSTLIFLIKKQKMINLQKRLLAYLSEVGVKPSKIQDGTAKNPLKHIIGNRAIYDFCRGIEISQKHLAVLELFFSELDKKQ